jgi:uncharacterized SAM-binding protein YcdF (DUF218 family)
MFFYAAKIVWFFAQPSSVIAIALMLGTILTATAAWRRFGRWLLIGGLVALLVCGLSPLGELLILPLENRFPRPDLARGGPVAGIIILGGAIGANSNPPRELAGLNESAERMTEAVVLTRQFPDARLVFTGGSAALLAKEPPESATMARLLEGLGVAKERTVLESRSRDTYENAAFTKRLVDPRPGQRWLLVTSGWHMPRAMGSFRKAGFPVEPWPVDYRTSGRLRLRLGTSVPEGLRRVDFVTKEYLGLVVYYLTGRTSALLPGP